MSQSTVMIETADGSCSASLFKADNAAERAPAVLVYMDGIGIRPALFTLCERIAAHGYVVLLPDLFYRAGPYEAPDPRTLFSDPALRSAWFAKYASSASQANVMKDTRSFLDFLSARAD